MKSLFKTAIILLSLCLPVLSSWAQDESSLEKLAEEILKAVSEVRGLELLHPVPKGVLSREEIEAVFRKRISEEYSIEELEKERSLLVKLGVLPREYDYVEGTMRVLNEQVAGYYDPRDQTLFIADWLPTEIQQMTMAHELTHALQDQHYELEAILSESGQTGDVMLARRALVEGDAVAVMFDYLLRPLGQSFVSLPNLKDLYEQTLQQQLSNSDMTQQLQDAPPFVRDSLLFSYVWGARFMQVFRENHPWSEADALYERLPTSTEQIMHPELYLQNRDEPTTLDSPIDDELLAWDIEYSETLGEFQSFLVLREHLPEAEALEAAAGWDGDQVRLLKDTEGRLAVQWDSIWDSPSDAEQFRDRYVELIQSKYSLGEPQRDAQGILNWENEFDRIQIRHSNRTVRVLEIEKVPVRRKY